ncbi:MAG TPA: hypothetical protein VF121_17760 [Thermoanaerobaculia bacterium]|nr:hypothetical protein [Thermoanaerobaculia bacterium]
MPETSIADKVTRWKTLADAMRTRLEEFPQLAEEHAELVGEVAKMEALIVTEDAFTARLRDTFAKRRETETRCLDMAARCTTGLQSHYGKRSQELRHFGIGPLLPRRKRKDEEEKKAEQEKAQKSA